MAAEQSTIEPRVPGIYRGWLIVAVVFLINMIGLGPVFHAYAVYSQFFVVAFNAPRTLVTLAYSALLVVSGLASGAFGWLEARLGVRGLTIACLLSCAISLALVSLSTSIWQVVLLFATLLPMTQASLGIVGNVLLNGWFERRRGLAVVIAAAGTSAATIVFPPLSALTGEALGWRMAIVINSGLMLCLTPLVWFAAKAPLHGIPAWERVAPHGDESPGTDQRREARAPLLRDATFWGLTLTIGAYFGVQGAVVVSLVPFAICARVSQTDAAYLVSLLGAAAFLGKMLLGALADRVNLRMALRLTFCICFIGLTILWLGNGYRTWLAAAACFGLASGCVWPLWGLLFAQIYGSAEYGRNLGYSRLLMTPLIFGGPVAAGAIYDALGSYHFAWLFCMAVVAGALALTFVGSAPRNDPERPGFSP